MHRYSKGSLILHWWECNVVEPYPAEIFFKKRSCLASQKYFHVFVEQTRGNAFSFTLVAFHWNPDNEKLQEHNFTITANNFKPLEHRMEN